jgi:hypothetical protein
MRRSTPYWFWLAGIVGLCVRVPTGKAVVSATHGSDPRMPNDDHGDVARSNAVTVVATSSGGVLSKNGYRLT